MEKANHQRRIAIILSAGFVFFLMLCPVLAETQRQGAILIEAQIQTEEGLPGAGRRHIFFSEDC